MKYLIKLTVVFVLLIVLVGQASTVLADTSETDDNHKSKLSRLVGTVTAIHDNAVTVQTKKNETFIVNLTTDSKIRLVEAKTDGDLSNIEVGHNVVIRGHRTAENGGTAKKIMVFPKGDAVWGKVTSVDDSTVILENRQGDTFTVVINSEATIRQGTEEITVTEIQVGKGLVAIGTDQPDGTLSANFVIMRAKDHRRLGEVTAIDGSTLTMITRRGETINLLTDDETKYRRHGEDAASFEDIEVGSTIRAVVESVEGQDNTAFAKVIRLTAQ